MIGGAIPNEKWTEAETISFLSSGSTLSSASSNFLIKTGSTLPGLPGVPACPEGPCSPGGPVGPGSPCGPGGPWAPGVAHPIQSTVANKKICFIIPGKETALPCPKPWT